MKIRSWAIALIFVCLFGLFMGPGIAESRITDVSAAPSGCGIALNDNGSIWLWGSISYNSPDGLQPVVMPGMGHVVAISGNIFPAVLKDDGTVWIIRNYPAFENASLLEKYIDKEPVKVPGLDNIVAISGNSGNLLMLSENGTVWAMGGNWYGQLGPAAHYGDSDQFSLNVVQVTGLSDIKAISMGGGHALALKKDGTVWAWGQNNMGQRGDGTILQHPHGDENGDPTPAMVKGLTGVTSIAAGEEFSMALKSDGTVWTWGRNSFGQLGDGMPVNVEDHMTTPVQVKGLANVTSIAAGRWYALALRDDGTVWSWGDNRDFGMLGDGALECRNVPGQVKGISGIVSISAGDTTAMALDKYGVIWAWGNDGAGELGDGRQGTYVYRATADKVPFSEALAGPAVEPAWMVSSRPQVEVSVPAQDDGAIEYMAAINDTIYAFTSNSLTALDSKGEPLWNISIPGTWTYKKAYSLLTITSHVNSTLYSYNAANSTLTITTSERDSMGGQNVKMAPTFAAENGNMYLYAIANASDSTYNPMDEMLHLEHPIKSIEKVLIAVAPDGKVKWSRSFTDNVAVQDRSHVEAHGGRIYLYHDYNETVLDASGKLLFNIGNVADPVSVDEEGNIYTMAAVKYILPAMSTALDGEYFDYRLPSNVVTKYGPDGKLVWQKELQENASQPYFMPPVWNDEIGIPLYKNGMLYVPVDFGVIALDTDGKPLWTKKLDDAYKLFYLMPMDSKGNLYLYNQHSYDKYHDSNMTIIAVKPDGSELGRVDVACPFVAYASEGVLYKDGRNMSQMMARVNFTPDNLDKVTVTAYDMAQGKYVWSFTTPIGDTRTVMVNESNVLALFPDNTGSVDPAGSAGDEHSRVQVIPAGDLTYIYFRTAAWDMPVVYNKSRYTYYSTLYALDKDGRLVWQKPMDNFITAATANNTTIYYSTNGGGISVSTIEVVAGLAFVASVLLFIKFFALGSVTRARSKLDKNDNRNRVYRFIAERPGSTLYEMSKEMRLNIGTLRYHLMILSLNHRIVSYNDDGKFVRYFTNSNSYNKEDQMVIALVRRESMGKILKLILEGGEMTNGEVCGRLGLPESAISKYLGELLRKGIVTKAPEQGVRASYSIKEEHRGRLSNAVKLMDSPAAAITMNGPLPQADTYV